MGESLARGVIAVNFLICGVHVSWNVQGYKMGHVVLSGVMKYQVFYLHKKNYHIDNIAEDSQTDVHYIMRFRLIYIMDTFLYKKKKLWRYFRIISMSSIILLTYI